MPWWAFLVVWVSHVAGWPLIAAGVLGAIIWVVLAIRDMAISKPARIIATTPYAFSRSSMYVAWTLLYTSIALVVNST
jgi:protein-S-isoprenylcysteine O-methyltransferase Ste14